VPAAPAFSYSIYAAHSQRGATRLVEPIRAGLKACARNCSAPMLTDELLNGSCETSADLFPA